MATLTVIGVGGSEVTVSISSAQLATIAEGILNTITDQVEAGNLTPYEYNGVGPLGAPTVPSYLIMNGPGVASLPASTEYIVNVAGGPVLLFGGDAASQDVVSDPSLIYVANRGVGTVVASGGNNVIMTDLAGSGDHLFLTDGGNNEILAFSGNDTIGAGEGRNSILLGSGNDLVVVTGQDSILAGSGNDTVDVTSGSAVVHAGAGALTFANADGFSTVFGGSGAETVFGGAGGGLYQGGAAGNNLLVGGQMATTLFGGGAGDTLIAEGAANDLLVAGRGNETLIGLGSGADTFVGGRGADSITGGFGYNTLVAGSGGGTLTGGSAGNAYVFVAGASHGAFVVTDFTVGADTIDLEGFGKGEINRIIRHQVDAGGNVTIELKDHTSVTFLGVSHLNPSSFG
jgi:Ca2+-binding RTX toxin-like protein